VFKDEEEEQSIKLTLGQPWVWSVNDFIVWQKNWL